MRRLLSSKKAAEEDIRLAKENFRGFQGDVKVLNTPIVDNVLSELKRTIRKLEFEAVPKNNRIHGKTSQNFWLWIEGSRFQFYELFQDAIYVGLSTAFANAQDLANWLDIKEMGLYNFKPSVRPSLVGSPFASESNLLCLHGLLNAAPELLTSSLLYLLEPLNNSLKYVADIMRIQAAQVILWAYGLDDREFDANLMLKNAWRLYHNVHWNISMPWITVNWEIHVTFKVQGKGTELFRDGFAIWYAKERMQPGPVFGSDNKPSMH
ncbi:hypothetical protein GQX74_011711 [Glossina fuscipes]|nr:hypothetical protein GQX74_011711 [Glossina fuscipes]